MNAPDRELSIADAIASVTLGFALITGVLYMAGWAYVYHYFNEFRIPMLLLDFPFQHYLVYGGLVVFRNLLAAITALLIAILAVWLAVRCFPRIGRVGVTAMTLLFVLGAFALARIGWITTAEADVVQERANDYPAYPRVHLVLDAGASETAKALGDIVTQDCGRLLAASKDNLFLIRPVSGAGELDLHTFVVATRQVTLLRIRQDSASCK